MFPRGKRRQKDMLSMCCFLAFSLPISLPLMITSGDPSSHSNSASANAKFAGLWSKGNYPTSWETPRKDQKLEKFKYEPIRALNVSYVRRFQLRRILHRDGANSASL